MASGRSIVTDATDKLMAMGTTGSQIAGIFLGLQYGMKALLIVLAVITVVDAVQSIIHMVKPK